MKCEYCNQDRLHLIKVDYDDQGKTEIRKLCLLCIYKRGREMFDGQKFRDEIQYKIHNRQLQQDKSDI